MSPYNTRLMEACCSFHMLIRADEFTRSADRVFDPTPALLLNFGPDVAKGFGLSLLADLLIQYW